MAMWYCVKTHVGKELLAQAGLERQNYTVFIPKFPKTVKRSRKSVSVLKPLFPGYVFVQMDPQTQRWAPIDSTRGVTCLVKFGDQPSPVERGLVEALKARTGPNGQTQFNEEFQLGDHLRVIGGAFDHWIGEVVRKPDHERAILLLDMLSRKVEITVSRQQVIKVA